MNKVIENENKIRNLIQEIDNKYPTKLKVDGFAFKGFKLGLWIGYPDCKFYVKNTDNVWNYNKAVESGLDLSTILLKNYNISKKDLHNEIKTCYAQAFQTLNTPFKLHIENLKSLYKYHKIRNKKIAASKIPTLTDIENFEQRWSELLENEMKIISEDFKIVSKADFKSFFKQIWKDGESKTYKLTNK